MKSEEFWKWFDETVREKLDARASTFVKMFEYLDTFDRPVGIVETGCARLKDNWQGDGCSTVLFDKYAEYHPGSLVYTVDMELKATEVCRSLVSDRVVVHTGDSVVYFKDFARLPPPNFQLDLLYLDSSDNHFNAMKEFAAIAPLVRPDTLVAVDDSPLDFRGIPTADQRMVIVGEPKIGGKGEFLSDYAKQFGAELYFTGYQVGWLKLGVEK